MISHQTLASGRARLIPKAGREIDRYIEVEGMADLVVEIVSDSSVKKDTRRSPPAYFQAGVAEYWLVNARRHPPVLLIHHRGPNGFEPVSADADGFQSSAVLGRRYRLDSTRDSKGNWEFDLPRSVEAAGSSPAIPDATARELIYFCELSFISFRY